MASGKDNTIFENTSFLQGSNSPFIEELYLKYLNDRKSYILGMMKEFDWERIEKRFKRAEATAKVNKD